MPRRHLAVVLLLRGPVATEVDALRRALGDQDIERIPSHITLVPPANVREDEFGGVLATLRDAAAAVRPVTLELGPTATFLPTSPTLYLAVDGDRGILDELARLRRELLVGPLDRPATRPFVPHVTLLNPAAPAVLERGRDALAGYRASVTFARVDLLENTDRLWRPIADAALSTSKVTVGRGSLPLELAESSEPDPQAAAFASREWQAYDDEKGATAGGAADARWEQDPFAITARRDGSIVGVATGWTREGVAFLSELLVGAAVRSEGIGSHLLAAAEALARRRGCRTLVLRTEAGTRAVVFYGARGWSIETTLRAWFGGRDFVQLRRRL